MQIGLLPGRITGYTGLGVSLNLPASTGLPYGIVAGLLLIIISDAFAQNDGCRGISAVKGFSVYTSLLSPAGVTENRLLINKNLLALFLYA